MRNTLIQKEILCYCVVGYLVIVFLFFVSSIHASGHTGNNSTEAIQPIKLSQLHSGVRVLRVGHMDNIAPFYFFDQSQQLTGLEYDAFKAVAKKAQFKRIKFISYSDFTALAKALQNGEVDIIANNYWNTPKRSERFLLTKPYYQNSGIGFLFLKNGAQFYTPADLIGNKVGIFGRSAYLVSWLHLYAPGVSVLKKFNSSEQLLGALRHHEVDVGVSYYTFGITRAINQGSPDFTATLVQPMEVVYALRKNDWALYGKINRTIQFLQHDGTLQQIENKYVLPGLVKQPATF